MNPNKKTQIANNKQQTNHKSQKEKLETVTTKFGY